MLFNSYAFLFAFLPVTLLIFFLLGKVHSRLAAAWLAVSSVLFYAWWDYRMVGLLLASVTFNYLCSVAIHHTARRPKLQNAVLAFGIVVDLGVLFFYKYLPATVDFLQRHEILASHQALSLVLPLGISFFTFTQIGFLMDVKQGIAKERGALSYAVFVTFFPHLIAGPILHNREMMPQFEHKRIGRLTAEDFAVGLTIFLIGLMKKTIIADNIAIAADIGFAHPEMLGFFGAWGAALSYTFQLYFDFSGYSDMAIGLARMFGVTFPANFNSPYKATSIIDFWQRWHMTLTRYLTMYLYNPVALRVTRQLSKGGAVPRPSKSLGHFGALVAMPTMLTMVLAGVWHGAGLQYLIFGALHGVFISINHAWRIYGPKKSKAPRPPLRSWAVTVIEFLLTFAVVLVGWIFFRSTSVEAAMVMFKALAGLQGIEPMALPSVMVHALGPLAGPLLQHGAVVAAGWTQLLLAGLLAALFLAVWMLPNTQNIMAAFGPVLGKVKAAPAALLWRPRPAWAVVASVLLAVSIMSLTAPTRFIYFQF